MTSLATSSLNSGVTGYAATAFGTGQEIARSFGEKLTPVAFLRGNSVLVSFDAVVQETHSVEAQPTAFPIEDGSTISDHVIRTPRELSLQGIITDTPLRDKKLLAQEAVTSLAGYVAGPIGVLALSQAQAFASSQALAESVSPSIANYLKIVAMATGSNGIPPFPFTVRTAIYQYENMIIRSVSVPRDVTTGAALVFGITLTSMTIVSSRTTQASITSVPKQAIARDRKGEEEADKTGIAYQEGNNRIHVYAGKAVHFNAAPSVYTGD